MGSQTNNIEDVTTKCRGIKGTKSNIINTICFLFSIFVLLMNTFLILPTYKIVIIFLGFLLFLVFLLYPANKKSPKENFTVLDFVLAVAGALVALYSLNHFDIFFAEGGFKPTSADYIYAIILILLILEGTRRLYGNIIPGMVLFSILYLRFGQWFPGELAHKGFMYERILIRMAMSDTGIFGIVLNIAVNYVFLFVLFGSILQATGASDLFSNIAFALVGRRPGGPAEVSALSSALMGTLSGSSIANVATTGSFTIPLMKKAGYSGAFAGGVEAAASTGGMIMPPVMGAAALIMSGFLGIPYIKIIVAAIIPALLYYLAIFIIIELRAKKIGLVGIDESELPEIKSVLKNSGHLLLPIFILVYLLVRGYSPTYAATIGIIMTIVVSALKSNTRLSFKKIYNSFYTGAISAIPVSVMCAAIGIVVETISMTGLGSVLARSILSFSGGNPILTAFFVMLVSLVASIGLPATACYVIVVSVAAPALGKIGIIALATHFFVFWYGCISGLTPPVALASYTAACMAKADPFKTAFEGLKLATASFIIPFFLVFNTELLLYGVDSIFQLVATLFKTILSIFAIGISLEGFLYKKIKLYERVLLFFSVFLLIQKGKHNIIGVLLIILILFINFIKKSKEESKE